MSDDEEEFDPATAAASETAATDETMENASASSTAVDDHLLSGDDHVDDDDNDSTSVQADDVDGALALIGSATVSINQDDNATAVAALLPTNHLLAAAAAAASDIDINAASMGAAAAAAPDEVDGLALISSATALQPRPNDVLSGRGASVNSNEGNKKFRALCFARKAEFDAGNHAVKRRIATQIVDFVITTYGSRFYKNMSTTATAAAAANKGAAANCSNSNSGWYEMTREQALLKACQVMRDYKRPDRIAQGEASMEATGVGKKKRNRTTPSTPMDDVPVFPVQPIAQSPEGVHDHDVLSGRGAFVNGHSGNERLRKLAAERKAKFDAGNCMARRTLAVEIVTIIRNLDPPGRFLKQAKATGGGGVGMEGGAGAWEEVTDEKAIHKACQVMRDLDRPDRKDRGGGGERRGGQKKRRTDNIKKAPPAGTDDHHQRDTKSSSSASAAAAAPPPPSVGAEEHQEATDSITLLAETLVGDSSEVLDAAEDDDNNVDEEQAGSASSENDDEQENVGEGNNKEEV